MLAIALLVFTSSDYYYCSCHYYYYYYVYIYIYIYIYIYPTRQDFQPKLGLADLNATAQDEG